MVFPLQSQVFPQKNTVFPRFSPQTTAPGPGQLTARGALGALRRLAEKLDAAAVPRVDVERVLVAGHSMGGHGAW